MLRPGDRAVGFRGRGLRGCCDRADDMRGLGRGLWIGLAIKLRRRVAQSMQSGLGLAIGVRGCAAQGEGRG